MSLVSAPPPHNGTSAVPDLPTPFYSPWMRYADVAAYSHFSISKIEKAVAAGKLKSTGSGKNRRFHRDWIDQWITSLPGDEGQASGTTDTTPQSRRCPP